MTQVQAQATAKARPAEEAPEVQAATDLQDTTLAAAADQLVDEINDVLAQCRDTVLGCLNGTVEEDYAKVQQAWNLMYADKVTRDEANQFYDAWRAKWGSQYVISCSGLTRR